MGGRALDLADKVTSYQRWEQRVGRAGQRAPRLGPIRLHRMLRLERHEDVTRLELSSWIGRLLGYTVSAYVVDGVLIDTGFPRAARELAAWVGAHRAALSGAIVTHWHEDHSGGAFALSADGLPLAIHPETERRVRQAAPLELYRRLTWGSFPEGGGAIVPFTAPRSLEVLHMPGHSPEHHVVWAPETGTLFAGDLFLGVKVRIAHSDEDFRELLVSLRTCAALGPARMFCGHRGLVPNAESALSAKADWLEETIATIGNRAAQGWSDAQIVRDVLGGEELTGRVSWGHYSRATFVRAARRAAA